MSGKDGAAASGRSHRGSQLAPGLCNSGFQPGNTGRLHRNAIGRDRAGFCGPDEAAMRKLATYYEKRARIETCRWTGTVTELVGLLVESNGPAAAIGDFCEINTQDGRSIRTQVIGFREGRVLSMPLEETDGLHLGDPITARKGDARMEVGPQLLGRVIDGFGKPLDGLGPVGATEAYDLYASPPGPLDREPIGQPLITGIRAIDSLLTCGTGPRIGIIGGS